MKTKTNRILPFLGLYVLLLPLLLSGNNIEVKFNGIIPDGSDYAFVSINLSWENAWRDSENHDAAWLFVKYRHSNNTGPFRHLNLTVDNHYMNGPLAYSPGLVKETEGHNPYDNPVVGLFVYLNSERIEPSVGVTDLRLRFNLPENGLSHTGGLTVRVYAIEMVYIPQGAFYLGDGNTTRGAFYQYCGAQPCAITPYLVNSSAPIRVDASMGRLYYDRATDPMHQGDQTGETGGEFPNGYNAFYLMKYQISQMQYVAFLNSLGRMQQDNRTQTSLRIGIGNTPNVFVMANTPDTNPSNGNFRNGISVPANFDPNEPIEFLMDMNMNGYSDDPDDGGWIACAYLSWDDLAAYLDWAGLRPMTELEYEKAARGPFDPVMFEYAWGDWRAVRTEGLTDENTRDEIANNPLANSVHGFLGMTGLEPFSGPIRVGAFAKANTSRHQAGAGYYGNMELSGNLWEMVVTIGNEAGRNFRGIHGNGQLLNDSEQDAGFTNIPAQYWPSVYFNTPGHGYRGGSWRYPADAMMISSRLVAAASFNGRYAETGGRGARTAPSVR